MELFKTGDYTIFEKMPVKTLNDLINWKIELENERKKQLEEDVKKQKENNRTYRKK
jgi:hypothetical protein